MSETAKLTLGNNTYELPIITGTENEKGIDISKLRGESGHVTLDVGFKNTGSTTSAITYIDGEKGILRYRGYPIEQLAEKADFLEVAYLCIYKELPTESELSTFKERIGEHNLIHENMKKFLDGYPPTAHPMGMLSSMINSLSSFYPESLNPNQTPEEIDITIARLIAKIPIIASWIHKKRLDHPFLYPKKELGYVENYLAMTFGDANGDYEVDPVVADAMDKLLILHADHEQNCSAATVRVVGSSHANLYASICAGICALWGPRHGGANQKVIEMLEAIKADGGDVSKYIAKAKDKNDPFRLMGFGHRVYKNFDPRAKIIKKSADDVLAALKVNDPILDIAKGLEETALSDDYFVSRKLFPNVDFYSGIIYRALGFPMDMFTVLFALGRLPGWIAQWREMRIDNQPIGRPRQIYTGAALRDYPG